MLQEVLTYHDATKHHFRAYARGPGYMDWATQPDPFRRYQGAKLIPLRHVHLTDLPDYEAPFNEGRLSAQPVTLETISQLFYDALAISAWKQAGGERWALRVNPSSGNLHPTEGYLIFGPVAGIHPSPAVYHYAPKEHGLELRREFSAELWERLTAGFPQGTFFLGLTSIHWRESWKYGERAYRYCQHDAGHAIAALALSAAALGWKAVVLEDVSDDQICQILGLGDQEEPEAEHPDCLLAVFPQEKGAVPLKLPSSVMSEIDGGTWHGRPNVLSSAHHPWPLIDQVTKVCWKPETDHIYPAGLENPAYRVHGLFEKAGQGSACVEPFGSAQGKLREKGPAYRDRQGFLTPPDEMDEHLPNIPPGIVACIPLSFRKIVHQRRSAMAYDGMTSLSREAFYKIVQKVIPGPGRIPFSSLPWPVSVHLGLFVHRVDDLSPGLYFLVRDPSRLQDLKTNLHDRFAWEKPEGCPAHLPLYLLARGDCTELAMQLSCGQDIAGDSAFSLGMIAEFEKGIREYGAWFYRRLFWETGVIGQVLYLEAEAAGLRGTGIGCFFDDPVHEVFGLTGHRYQSLYHFTIGGPLEDPRITTLPPYSKE